MTQNKEPGWLKGCTVCSDGLAQEMEQLIREENISERAAAQRLADEGNAYLGAELFNMDKLRARYRSFVGRHGPVINVHPKTGERKIVWTRKNKGYPAVTTVSDVDDWPGELESLANRVHAYLYKSADLLEMISPAIPEINEMELWGRMYDAVVRLRKLCNKAAQELEKRY